MSKLKERIAKLEPWQREALLKRLAKRNTRDSSQKPDGSGDDPERLSFELSEIPLSYSQRRMWVFQKLNPASTSYNVLAGFHFRGQLNKAALQESLWRMVDRHQALRTVYPESNGQPYQQIQVLQKPPLHTVSVNVTDEHERTLAINELIDEAESHVFDLTTGPVFIPTLLALSSSEHVLLVTMHHICSDGWSMNLLAQELQANYAHFSDNAALDQVAPKLHYADYAVWQNRALNTERSRQELSYWKKQLTFSQPVLSLPTDRSRPHQKSHLGNTLQMNLDAELVQDLEAFAKSRQCSLYMVLLATFKLLLAAVSGDRDINVAVPVASRERKEFEQIIGCFANTVVLRTELSWEETFPELLGSVRKTALAAFANGSVPFDKVVDALGVQRSLDRAPLTQVLFVLQNVKQQALSFSGLEAERLDVKRNHVDFDLQMQLLPNEDGLAGELTYRTDLFDASTVERLLQGYKSLLAGVAVNPERTLPNLCSVIGERVEATRVVEPAPEAAEQWFNTLMTSLTRTATSRPQHVAFSTEHGNVSYADLLRRVVSLQKTLAHSRSESVHGILTTDPAWVAAFIISSGTIGRSIVVLDSSATAAALQKQCSEKNVSTVWVASEDRLDTVGPIAPAIRVLGVDDSMDGTVAETGVSVTRENRANSGVILVSGDSSTVLPYWRIKDQITDVCRTVGVPTDVHLVSEMPLASCAGVIDLLVSVANSGLLRFIDSDQWDTIPAQKDPLSESPLVFSVFPSHLATIGQTLSDRTRPIFATWCGGELIGQEAVNAYARSTGVPLYLLGLTTMQVGVARVQKAASSERPGLIPLVPVRPCSLVVVDTRGEECSPGMVGRLGYGHVAESPYSSASMSQLATGRISENTCELELASSHQPTSILARRLNDGSIEPLEHGQAYPCIAGRSIDLEAICAAARQTSKVTDCVAEARMDNSGRWQVVVWLAGVRGDLEAIKKQVSSQFTWNSRRIRFVRINAIPRTPQGEVAFGALHDRAVIDDITASQWARSIELSSPGRSAEVQIDPVRTEQRSIEVASLIGESLKSAIVNACAPIQLSKTSRATRSQTPAILVGPDLSLTHASSNLADTLVDAVKRHPDHGMRFISEEGSGSFYTYSVLLEEARRVAAGLHQAGVVPGTKCVLVFSDNYQFVTAFWACVLVGAVAVPVDVPADFQTVNAQSQKLVNVWDLVGRSTFLTQEERLPQFESLRAAFGLSPIQVLSVSQLADHKPIEQLHEAEATDLVLMLLTSGSTGAPKAVMHNHQTLLSRCELNKTVKCFDDTDVSLNWMPLQHVGGIVMFHLMDVYLGCHQIHVKTEYILENPVRWIELMDEHRVSMTWAPSFAFSLINSNHKKLKEASFDLSSLRFIMNAGELIVPKTARRFVELLLPHNLPPTAMHPVWGMSETSSGVTYNCDFRLDTTSDEDSFVNIGMPGPGIQVRVVGDDGQTLSMGEVGQFQVSGATVTPGYYCDEERTRELFTEDGWLRTGDLGVVEVDGVTITGREKDTIIVNGINYYAHEIEAVVDACDGVLVSNSAACAVRVEGNETEQLVIFFVPEREDAKTATLLENIRQSVIKHIGLTPKDLIALQSDQVPKTSIGKIQRSALTRAYVNNEFERSGTRVEALDIGQEFVPSWFYRPAWRSSNPGVSSNDIVDGASLVFVSDSSLDDQVLHAIRENASQSIAVRAGEAFERLDALSYVINPDAPHDYHKLLRSCRVDGLRITHIVHLWNLHVSAPDGLEELDRSHDRGFYSLVYLTWSIAQSNDLKNAHNVDFHVVTRDSKNVFKDRASGYASALVSGLLKTVSQEWSNLRCRHIDLPHQDDHCYDRFIALERFIDDGSESVAYRQGRRWFEGIEHCDMPLQHEHSGQLRKGGTYLLAGGLGGIGFLLAKLLLTEFQAKLVIVGRSQADDSDPSGTASAKADNLKALRQLSPNVFYAAADVSSPNDLERALAMADEHYQSDGLTYSGVFNLIGSFESKRLQSENKSSLLQALQAKVRGTYNLHHLVQHRRQKPSTLFVNFSSVNAIFGGIGAGAYSAANSFLRAFTDYQNTHEGLASYCVHWSMWRKTGMSIGLDAPGDSSLSGYYQVSPYQGLVSLLAAINGTEKQLIVGLDSRSERVSRSRQDVVHNVDYLNGFCATEQAHEQSATRELEPLYDDFGQSVRTALSWVEHLPSNTTSGSAQESGSVTPPNQVEEDLATIWREVLGRETIDRHDNFFALGGDSILSAQVAAKANDKGYTLSSRDVFEFQSIAALSTKIQPGKSRGLTQSKRSTKPSLGCMSPIQHWFFEQNFVTPNYWNLSLLLRCTTQVDLNALQRAVDAMVDQHVSLRMCFDTQRLRQATTLEATANEIKQVRLAESGDAPLAKACEDAQSSLNVTSGTVFTATVIVQDDSEYVLFACHHLVVDGVSWRILMADFLTAYAQAKNHQPVQLPASSSHFSTYCDALNALADSQQVASELPYWLATVNEAPKTTKVPVTADRTSHKTVNVEFTEEATTALLQDCVKRGGVKPLTLLLSAFALAQTTLNDQESIYIDLEGHGREPLDLELDVNRTVGWFTSLYPVAFQRPSSDALADWPAGVQQQLDKIPNGGIGYGLLRYCCSDKTIRDQLARVGAAPYSFNYLGQFNQTLGDEAGFEISTLELPMQRSSERATAAISCVGFVIDGTLRFGFEYCDQIHSDESVERMASQFQTSVLRLIEDIQTDPVQYQLRAQYPRSPVSGDALVSLLEEHRQRSPSTVVEDIYPVTAIQQGLLYPMMLNPTAGTYVSQLVNDFEGDIDPSAFIEAWQTTINRHMVYRTSFWAMDKPVPLQVVCNKVTVPVSQLDWTSKTADEQHRAFDQLMADDRKTGFNVELAPLLRVYLVKLGSKKYRIVISEHHAVSDGWSRAIILKEVFEVYLSLCSGHPADLSPACSYRDYVDWQARQDHGAAETFWRSYLSGFTVATPLLVERSSRENHDSGAARLDLECPIKMSQAVVEYARAHQVTVSTLCQAAWGIVLNRYSGDADVLFGVTVSGRPIELSNYDQIVGPCINNLPVRLTVDHAQEVVPWLQSIQSGQADLDQYSYSSPLDIKSWSEVDAGAALFDSVLVYENYPEDEKQEGVGGLTLLQTDGMDQTDFPIMFLVTLNKQLALRMYYDHATFSKATVSRLLTHFSNVLEQMTSGSVRKTGDLTLLSREEYAQIDQWNDSHQTIDTSLRVQQLFDEQVSIRPEQQALVYRDQTFSYKQVATLARNLSMKLIAQGATPNTLIAVGAEKGWQQVVAVLGILYSGAAYMPLDITWPKARRDKLIEQGDVSIVVVSEGSESPEHWPEHVSCVLVDNNDAEQDPNWSDQPRQSEHDLAYVIFTSGSTGNPKGVMISHFNVVNTLIDVNTRLNVTEQDAVIAVSDLTFDLSVYDIFGVLGVGGSVVIPDEFDNKDPMKWIELCSRHDVTIWNTVPALFELLIQQLERSQDQPALALRSAMLSGDWIPLKLPDRARKAIPGLSVLSLGGATEASIWSICYPIGEVKPDWSSIPYGYSMLNQTFYVRNELGDDCPVGIPGELYIGGVGVAQGYWRNDAQTAAQFVQDPKTGERLYRTGDLGRFTESGAIEFLGRADFQVKVNGYRIELGEIESHILAQATIKEAVVIVREDESGAKRLVAYVVSDEEPQFDQLRDSLKERLPSYMVPWFYVRLSSLPLSSNGKVLRNKLPEPTADQHEAVVAGALTPTQELISGIWSEVLDIDRPGIHDNFFMLGGHSLYAAQAMSRIKHAFDIELPIRTLFESPTVADLSKIVDTRLSPSNYQDLVKLEHRPEGWPLSYAQNRLWFTEQLEGQSTTYNMPTVLTLKGALDVTALSNSFQALVDRHDAFRSTFREEQGVPRVYVDETALCAVNVEKVRRQDVEAKTLQLLSKPFNLETGPLLSVSLLEISTNEYRLIINMHHIVSDGWTIGIVARELGALYNAYVSKREITLPDLALDYQSYSQWHKQWLDSDVRAGLSDFWKDKLSGLPALLPLKSALPRPAVRTNSGKTLSFTCSPDTTLGLNNVSRQEGSTLFMTLLSALNVVLAHQSDQFDIAIGTTVANRPDERLESVCGVFVNQVVIRTLLTPQMSFAELIGLVRSNCLDAFSHQDLPFEMVVDDVGVQRDASASPLFQTKFVMQNVPFENGSLPGLEVEHNAIDIDVAKFDLQLNAESTEAGIAGSLIYNTDLFLSHSAEEILDSFLAVLDAVASSPTLSVQSLKKVLDELSNTKAQTATSTARKSAKAGLAKIKRKPKVSTP